MNRDKDGQLTEEEFVIAMYLVNLALGGTELPRSLPAGLVVQRKSFEHLFGTNSNNNNSFAALGGDSSTPTTSDSPSGLYPPTAPPSSNFNSRRNSLGSGGFGETK